MKINENAKKCVAFIQIPKADKSLEYAGTCFFVANQQLDNDKYVVTAKHVIEGIKKLGVDKATIKLNLKNGKTGSIEIKFDSWIYHNDENVDIALYPFELEENHDHLYYPRASFLNEEVIKENGIGCGEEVFITGLFVHHYGESRNSPIVRIGNIALMPSEIVKINGRLMEAYLIESRSIGGLSGSPVFVNLGTIRTFGGQLKIAQGEHVPHLLGIVYGHYNLTENGFDLSISREKREKINTGIAIVSPVSKLIETINKASTLKK